MPRDHRLSPSQAINLSAFDINLDIRQPIKTERLPIQRISFYCDHLNGAALVEVGAYPQSRLSRNYLIEVE